METSFELFGLTGYRLGLCAAAGMLLLFAAMLLLARRRDVQPTSVCWLTVIGFVLGIVCARLLYCLVNLADFVEAYENPWLMLRFFDGGLSLSGLLLGLLLAVPLAFSVLNKYLRHPELLEERPEKVLFDGVDFSLKEKYKNKM